MLDWHRNGEFLQENEWEVKPFPCYLNTSKRAAAGRRSANVLPSYTSRIRRFPSSTQLGLSANCMWMHTRVSEAKQVQRLYCLYFSPRYLAHRSKEFSTVRSKKKNGSKKALQEILTHCQFLFTWDRRCRDIWIWGWTVLQPSWGQWNRAERVVQTKTQM